MHIFRNDSLTSFDGLNALTTPGFLEIFDNLSLVSLGAIRTLTSLNTLYVTNNEALPMGEAEWIRDAVRQANIDYIAYAENNGEGICNED